jgi:hypothetical protein
VLVSQTVKDLVAGSGLAFGDSGEHELKGVPGVWRVYALGQSRYRKGARLKRHPGTLAHPSEAYTHAATMERK